jgi:hypothetical protein
MPCCIGMLSRPSTFLSFFDNPHGKRNADTRQTPLYVLEALMEDAEEDGIDLIEEDIGSLFLLFKTEIEVLDKRA